MLYSSNDNDPIICKKGYIKDVWDSCEINI